MSQQDQSIAHLIDSIANKHHGSLHFPVMSGTVITGSVDATNMVCSVLLSINDPELETTGTPGILLNSVSLNNNGFVLYPADGSQVWVCEIDGPGKWGVIKCSNLTKASLVIGGSSITVTDSLIQFNSGSNNGLVNGSQLATRLNNLENDINNLKTAFSSWTVVPNDGGAALKAATATWFASSLTVTSESDIEETTVKH